MINKGVMLSGVLYVANTTEAHSIGEFDRSELYIYHLSNNDRFIIDLLIRTDL